MEKEQVMEQVKDMEQEQVKGHELEKEQEQEEEMNEMVEEEIEEEMTDIEDVIEDEDSKVSSESSDSSERDGETEETDETAGWRSRSGICWSPTPAETLPYIPVPTGLTPGPTHHALSRISTVKSTFDLFLTDDIMKLILNMTNLQGRRSKKDWKDIDITDLQAFIGLLILSGVYRSHKESLHSLWDDQTGRPIFRATMALRRFNLIESVITFDDKLTRSRRKHDMLAAVRVLWEKWTDRLPMLFNPGRNVCVDKQLVAFRGNCRFRQYMPKKHARYGIKIWVTCDVGTCYAWRMQVYTGKEDGQPSEGGQEKQVVLDMLEGLRGHTVTCDKFFTSFSLSEELLLKRKIALVGTIRSNKLELPKNLLQIRHRAVFSSLFGFTKTHSLVSYIPRRGKNLLLLSSKHRAPKVNKRKPVIITDYNSCKRAVENLEKVLGTYSCNRRTRRWPMVMFFNIIDISAFNAFVLWTVAEPSWNQTKTCKRRLFLEELGKSLVTPQMARRQVLPRAPVASAVVEALQHRQEEPVDEQAPVEPGEKKRKQCDFCKAHKRKRVYNTCYRCEKQICKEHSAMICLSCSTLTHSHP
ncbi:piggyBac transposable element-derived protein 4-like isoform X1 [Labrus bergylta]|uniref:piggyBac transposable element-derived protein 4-like isoform X1 n=1 Tax=Labrus bergylta TaxID=56723 RepID=UPI0033137516